MTSQYKKYISKKNFEKKFFQKVRYSKLGLTKKFEKNFFSKNKFRAKNFFQGQSQSQCQPETESSTGNRKFNWKPEVEPEVFVCNIMTSLHLPNYSHIVLSYTLGP